MRSLCAAVLAAFLCLGGVAQADERAQIKEAFQNLEPSVGALYRADRGGDLTFSCSVTAIDRHEGKTVALTALHCVKQKNISYRVTYDGSIFYNAQVWKLPPDKPKRGEPEVDMALLLVDGGDIPLVPIGVTDQPIAGQKIAMTGFPLGVSKINYEGIISGYLDRPGDSLHGYALLQIFGAPGSSGSSVINVETGNVVAILVQAQQSRAGLPVIFGTPISYIEQLEDVTKEEEEEEK